MLSAGKDPRSKFTKNKKKVSQDEVIKICQKEYHNFDKKYHGLQKIFEIKGYVM